MERNDILAYKYSKSTNHVKLSLKMQDGGKTLTWSQHGVHTCAMDLFLNQPYAQVSISLNKLTKTKTKAPFIFHGLSDEFGFPTILELIEF